MGHWYDQNGPRHFEGKSGKGTTLRDARRLAKDDDHIFPSVTTIGQLLAKPALANWITEQAVLKAAEFLDLDDGPHYYQIDSGWAKKVIQASREETLAKADAGTEIHDIIERHFKGEPNELGQSVLDLLTEHCGPQEWVSEEYVCDPVLGYGGLCDLHSWDWVIDHKSKDEVDDTSRGWTEQAEQLAAYRHALALEGKCSPKARLANVFIGRDDYALKFYEHKDETAWLRFYHQLLLWQVTKKYGPMWEAINES